MTPYLKLREERNFIAYEDLKIIIFRQKHSQLQTWGLTLFCE